jgi:hypothetical protein
MNTTLHAAQVRQFGRPQTRTASHVPKIGNIENLKAHELRALAHNIDKSTRDGSISDYEIQDYFKHLDAVNERLAVVEAEARNAQPAMMANNAPAVVRSLGDNTKSLARDFSISKAIATIADGRALDGVEAEVTAEGRRQFAGTRGQVVLPDFVLKADKRAVYGNNAAQSGIDGAVSGKQTLADRMQTALHVQPLAEQLGAMVVDAFGSSSMLIPYLGRTSAGTADEGASVTSTATFSELTLTPQRYARVCTYSALALRTTGQALDQILAADFGAAHASAHDAAAFAAIRSNATYTAATETGTNGLAKTTLANVFTLAQDAMSATGSNESPVLICSPEGFKVIHSTVGTGQVDTLALCYTQATGKAPRQATNLADGNFDSEDIIEGASTATIAGAGLVIAGDMGSCVLARWGGLDLVIDPYSGNASGLITVAANSYVAAGITRDAFRALAVAGADIAAT